MFCSLIIRSRFIISFILSCAFAISFCLSSFDRLRSRHVNIFPSIEHIGSDFYIYVTCDYFTLGLTHSNSIQKNERLQTAEKSSELNEKNCDTGFGNSIFLYFASIKIQSTLFQQANRKPQKKNIMDFPLIKSTWLGLLHRKSIVMVQYFREQKRATI